LLRTIGDYYRSFKTNTVFSWLNSASPAVVGISLDQTMEIAAMPSLDRRIVAAGFVALAAISPVMARGVASDSKIYAINTTVAQRVPVPATAPTVTVATMRDASAEIVIAGSEPDPESFDRVGLESWWAKYQKSHPAR
jgi:hypothetical protein